jgi:hypothetical protein
MPSREALLEAVEVLNGAVAAELDESTKYRVHERLRELYELLAAAPDRSPPKESPP